MWPVVGTRCIPSVLEFPVVGARSASVLEKSKDNMNVDFAKRVTFCVAENVSNDRKSTIVTASPCLSGDHSA